MPLRLALVRIPLSGSDNLGRRPGAAGHAEIDGHFFFIVAARCTACGTERVLLDADFHGWNGFICRDPASAALRRPPLIPWRCTACQGTAHQGAIVISGEGKEDFVLEAGPEYDHGRWHDAFGWFSLRSTCVGCGHEEPELIEYETM